MICIYVIANQFKCHEIKLFFLSGEGWWHCHYFLGISHFLDSIKYGTWYYKTIYVDSVLLNTSSYHNLASHPTYWFPLYMLNFARMNSVVNSTLLSQQERWWRLDKNRVWKVTLEQSCFFLYPLDSFVAFHNLIFNLLWKTILSPREKVKKCRKETNFLGPGTLYYLVMHLFTIWGLWFFDLKPRLKKWN